MNNPDYQTVYGVGLLDDLHNYFPAFLYEQGRFQTLPQAFSYFRHQLNTRFNLFSYGASLYRDSTPAPPPTRQPQAYSWTTPITPVRTANDLAADMASLNFLTSLLGAREPIRMTPLVSAAGLGAGLGAQPRALAPDLWAAFTAPVIVRPSEAVLTANTELIVGSALPLTQMCSVCQDSIAPTEECRRLKPCQHVYHRTCIDQWFLRSVYCPTCRHDIRNATPPSPRLAAATAAPVPDLPVPDPTPTENSEAYF